MMAKHKMMNQFSAIYGQLFCCGCPGGLSPDRCDNKTGMIIYPVIGNSYAWLAGLLSLAVVGLAVVCGAVIYCKKRRQEEKMDTVSIIRFHDALLPKGNAAHASSESRDQLESYRNRGYVDPEPADVGGSQPALVSWASEDSLDSPFLGHVDTTDMVTDVLDTGPLT